ncbi:hypothetical protein Btru_002893 [Bulinus truncatus]|nr:hypothetical protein Btru_002893 [Bulinus truncatus]
MKILPSNHRQVHLEKNCFGNKEKLQTLFLRSPFSLDSENNTIRFSCKNMDTSADVEGFVNRFVKTRTGEKIYLELANEHVINLKPVCKRGSVSLGIFWVKVFQHTNNYPIHIYLYKKLYHAGSEFELQLRIEGISISINLQTGYLTLKGTFVIDWFVSQMPKILEACTMHPDGQRKKMDGAYTLAEMKALKEEHKKYYNKCIEKWPENALKQDADVMATGRKPINREAITEGFLNGEDLESYCPIPDLLDDSELKQQLVKLKKGKAIQGHVIYRLWLSTMNSWFGDPEAAEPGRIA